MTLLISCKILRRLTFAKVMIGTLKSTSETEHTEHCSLREVNTQIQGNSALTGQSATSHLLRQSKLYPKVLE